MPDPSNWQSLFQGGLGTRLTTSTTSQNVAVPGYGNVGQMILTNMGNDTMFVKVGVDSTVAATSACFPLFAGYQLVLPIAPYVAAIASANTPDLLINTGNGATS